MTAQFFKKPSGESTKLTEEKKLEQVVGKPKVKKVQKPTPERKLPPEAIGQAEAISSEEKEKFRQEILKEVEKSEKKATESLEPLKISAKAPKPTAQAAPPVKSKTLLEIESVLEKDLYDIYFKLEPSVQKKVKTKGEETSVKIEKILSEAKDATKQIFKLIVEWLKIIPGVNKFFIRQEAKIRTNKIMKLKK